MSIAHALVIFKEKHGYFPFSNTYPMFQYRTLVWSPDLLVCQKRWRKYEILSAYCSPCMTLPSLIRIHVIHPHLTYKEGGEELLSMLYRIIPYTHEEALAPPKANVVKWISVLHICATIILCMHQCMEISHICRLKNIIFYGHIHSKLRNLLSKRIQNFHLIQMLTLN